MKKADADPRYRITEIPISELETTVIPIGSVGAQAPRYDRERDEPAFERAWARVSERAPRTPMIPPPPGGFRLRGGRNRRLLDASGSQDD